MSEAEVPQPEEIYERTKQEGMRRLDRPLLEIVSTAIAAGFDIVVGITVLALLTSRLEQRLGTDAAHVVASLGFGVGFVFIVVGRAELFTENFLVPIAGLDRRDHMSWLALGRLWLLSPIFNVLGGTLMIVLLSVHSVLPYGNGHALVRTAETIHANGVLALFVSAIFAGALITAMTWFVEGQPSMLVRLIVAWISGAILALGAFDHVIVATLELVFGYRYGAHVPASFIAGNFFLAAAGNIVGGLLLVTLIRFTQAIHGGRARAAS